MKKEACVITGIGFWGWREKGPTCAILAKMFSYCLKEAARDADRPLYFLRQNSSGCGLFSAIDEGIDGIKRQFYQQGLKSGLHRVSPALFPFTIPNAISAAALIGLKLPVASYTFAEAGLSSASAIYYAQRLLENHKLKFALIGGSSITDTQILNPTKPPTPYANAAAAIILEGEKSAQAKKQFVYARLEESRISGFNPKLPGQKEAVLEELLFSLSRRISPQKRKTLYWLLSTPTDKATLDRLRKKYAFRFNHCPALLDTSGIMGYFPSLAQLLSLLYLSRGKKVNKARAAGQLDQDAVVIGIDGRGKAACLSLKL